MESPEELKDESFTIKALGKLALWRGARLLCPQCGARGLFRRYGRLLDQCPNCALVLRREQGAQTGAMYVTAAVCQTFAIVLIWSTWLLTDWSTTTCLLAVGPVVLFFCFLFLPRSQTFWVAVEYLTDAVNKETWVHPRR